MSACDPPPRPESLGLRSPTTREPGATTPGPARRAKVADHDRCQPNHFLALLLAPDDEPGLTGPVPRAPKNDVQSSAALEVLQLGPPHEVKAPHGH